jgi:hypothetical protein
MRRFVTSATALLISATLGVASAQSQTATPPAQQNQQQDKQQLPGSPHEQRNVDKALESESGRTGTQEPLPQTESDGKAPLVNGAWNVPGAPKDSQTVPSKFSERNAAIDKLPIGEASHR